MPANDTYVISILRRIFSVKLITRDTDYAIRAIGCIASANGEKIDVGTLAEKLKVPRPFLRKILQLLTKKGLLNSSKGKGGGFTLNVDPKKVSLFDLMEIIQGPFHLNEHKFRGRQCHNVNLCMLKKELDKIEERLIKDLRSIDMTIWMK